MTRTTTRGRQTLLSVAAAALLAGMTTGCEPAPDPQPDPSPDTTAATATPSRTPDDGVDDPDAVIQNDPDDATLKIRDTGPCDYDKATGLVTQQVSLRGVVSRDVIVTVWLTVTSADTVTTGALGHPLTAPDKVDDTLDVTAPLGPEHWNRNTVCAADVTWTPRAEG